jgi:hypothetical protein
VRKLKMGSRQHGIDAKCALFQCRVGLETSSLEVWVCSARSTAKSGR